MQITRQARRLLGLGAILVFLLGLGWASAAGVVSPVGLAQGPANADDDPGDDDGNNKSGNLRLATNTLPSLIAGQEGWVSLLWYAETDVCNVQVTAKAGGATISYPTNTGSFSSLYINDALAETNLDYTAFKITAPAGAGTQNVEFEATFTRLKDSDTLKKADNLVVKDVASCSGNSGKVRQTVPLRVAAPTGAAVVLETPTIQVAKGGPTWVPISFKGNAPNLTNFRVTVTAPTGFELVYPGDGTSSGLDKDSRLPVAVIDSAAVRLDPLETAPGTYQMPVKATWSGGSWSGTIAVKVVS